MIDKKQVSTPLEQQEHKNKRINETKQGKTFTRVEKHPDEGSTNGDLGMKAGEMWISVEIVAGVSVVRLNTILDNGEVHAVNMTRRP